MQQTEETELFVECPVASVQKVVRGKWSMVILSFLRHKTLRFGALSRKMPMVTQANLTKELRMLESYGLIHREVYPQVPPKVEYSLTEKGHKFMPVLDALETFASTYESENEKVVNP
ncbi:winged helix-turn-helix transcriptional regulator [Enterococcus casseliflavus]|uniref:winged helix-turn-helix transcriptional regulator n=1 Tax=Enterococcus casseliflavus TaxID=37734 RepID=UPI0022E151DE|nr:helix-turn-helix domain-containing protein [Enterococcus casseliflavus]